jgi:hypothetical protein
MPVMRKSRILDLTVWTRSQIEKGVWPDAQRVRATNKNTRGRSLLVQTW